MSSTVPSEKADVALVELVLVENDQEPDPDVVCSAWPCVALQFTVSAKFSPHGSAGGYIDIGRLVFDTVHSDESLDASVADPGLVKRARDMFGWGGRPSKLTMPHIHRSLKVGATIRHRASDEVGDEIELVQWAPKALTPVPDGNYDEDYISISTGEGSPSMVVRANAPKGILVASFHVLNAVSLQLDIVFLVPVAYRTHVK